MGLFNELGRRVERFKQSATAAAEEGTDYRCADCDALFHAEYEECPECGSEAIAAAGESATRE